MDPTFRVGDLAVYPAHGVAQIIGVETREISSSKQTFYILKILDNGMKIMIPTKNAGAVGLRELIREDEVDEVEQDRHAELTEKVRVRATGETQVAVAGRHAGYEAEHTREQIEGGESPHRDTVCHRPPMTAVSSGRSIV